MSAGGYYGSGITTDVTATALPRFTFTNFTGSPTSASNPTPLLMDGPKSITANFAATGTPLLSALISAKADGGAANERIWTVRVTNNGSGGIANPRIASAQILAANPAGNLGLISLGSTAYPVALANNVLSPGQSSTASIRIVFPATTPATRIQIRLNLAGDGGYANSITLSNQVR